MPAQAVIPVCFNANMVKAFSKVSVNCGAGWELLKNLPGTCIPRENKRGIISIGTIYVSECVCMRVQVCLHVMQSSGAL